MARHFQTLLTVALLACCFTATARATDVTDSKIGYSFKLPSGWRRVPDDALARMRSAAVRPGAKAPMFVAAFEPAEHKSYFQYPYLLVQVHSYGKGLNLATISRRELDDIVAEITGTPASKLKQNLSDDAAKAVRGVSIETPMVLTDPPSIAFETTVNAAGVGTVRSRTIGRLGRSDAVFVHYYAKDRGWMKNWDLLDKLDTSFRRTPEQVVAVAEATRTTGGTRLDDGWSSKSIMGVGKIIIGVAVLATACWFGWPGKGGNRPSRDE